MAIREEQPRSLHLSAAFVVSATAAFMTAQWAAGMPLMVHLVSSTAPRTAAIYQVAHKNPANLQGSAVPAVPTISSLAVPNSLHTPLLAPLRAPLRAPPLTADSQRARAVLGSLWALLPVGLLAALATPRILALATTTGTPEPSGGDGGFNFACLMTEVPKGTRKLVSVQGFNVLLFWYRNELFAIENSSPAEGAYKQGFENARFTQDYGILCPTTDTEFNLKTGAVVKWMPNNPVLRRLTPPCPPLEVFPVTVEGDEVKIQVRVSGDGSSSDGGARSSFERNNVFGIEPRVYLEDGTYIDETGLKQKTSVNPTTVVIATIAVAIIAVAGTALCLSFESIPALVLFWLVGFGVTAKVVYDFTDGRI